MAQWPFVPMERSQRGRMVVLVAAILGLVAAVWENRLAILYTLAKVKTASGIEVKLVHVDDEARLLGPFGAKLDRQAAGFSRDLGIDLQIVTVRGASEDVSSLAERLFRERGVGRASPTGGVLLVLDPVQSQARIEVSYSLEHVYPDALLSRLTREQLVPFASYQMVGMGVADVLHFLKDIALDAVASGDLTLPQGMSEKPDVLAGRSGGAGAQSALASFPADLDVKRRVPPEQRALYAPSADPMESAEAYARSLRDLAGDPTLELFLPQSRFLRLRAPFAAFEEYRRWQALEASRPWRLVVHGELAVVRSDKPARAFVPILLARMKTDGLWHVDLVDTWKYLFYGPDGKYFLRNTYCPFRFGLDALPNPASDSSVEHVELYGEEEEAAVARLERAIAAGAGPRVHVRLAEILFRNCWLVPEAMTHYERAAMLAPRDWRIAQTLADRASYVGFPEYAIPFLEPFGARAARRIGDLYFQAHKPVLAEQYYRRALSWEPDRSLAQRTLDWLKKEGGSK